MPRTTPILFPAVRRQVEDVGRRIRLARLRRKYSATAVAVRANITRSTLYRAENGDPGVSLGTYTSILRVLGLHADLDLIAKDDAPGRRLQDLSLPEKRVRRLAGGSYGPTVLPVQG